MMYELLSAKGLCAKFGDCPVPPDLSGLWIIAAILMGVGALLMLVGYVVSR